MSKILICGEAWGRDEDQQKMPFVGASGWHLKKMCAEAGINWGDCYLTNVFNIHPHGAGFKVNDLKFFCGSKKEAIDGYPQLGKVGWVTNKFLGEVKRLSDEIMAENPNVIIALGNTALWATTGKTAITKFRGTTTLSTHTAIGFKVLPTYHPAAVLRQWELRPLVIADLAKARRESAYPDLRRPKVTICIPETPHEIAQFGTDHIDGCEVLAVDIETSGNQITCIGFAPSRELALVIPIHDYRRADHCYWPTLGDEQTVWKLIREILGSRRPPKVFQNGLYDVAFLWRSYRIKVYGAEHDTMLLHHALQPEALKGLGFLGSVYTDHGPWKTERMKTHTIKRDE